MKSIKIITILIILMMAVSCFTVTCFADTVNLKSGDVLAGKVLTEYIGLRAEYQNLFFKKDFILSMMAKPDQTGHYTINTINNDQFSGTLINSQIEVALDTGKTVLLASDSVQGIYLKAPGETYKLATTIFVMHNGDRFSGRLLADQLNISTAQLSVLLDQKNINRIEFSGPGSRQADVYLTDGSLLSGNLAENVFGIAPDSIPKINVCVTQFKKIQFNAVKYIKKSITLDDYTDPETGQLEFVKLFPEISADVTSGGTACSMEDAGKEADVPDEKADENVEALKFSHILFDFNKTDIKPAFFELLDKVAGTLANNPSMAIQINGHTDIIGTDDYNQALSMNRAQMVVQYLLDAGITMDRISIHGYGFTLPVADNNTEQGKALNRRVEILLID